MIKKAGRPNLLDSHLIKKVKDIATGMRAAVINRRQILNIVKGVVKVSNPSSRVWWNTRVDRLMGERFTRFDGME